jgi:hypothetical protein
MTELSSSFLRSYLIERLGQVADTINIAPRKRVWQVFHGQVGVRKRILVVVVNGIIADLKYRAKRADEKSALSVSRIPKTSTTVLYSSRHTA